MSARIVVVGGGFAGVACARRLVRTLREGEAEVLLFNVENHMVFHPLLPDVAGASLGPDSVAVSLRQRLPGVRFRSEPVLGIDLAGAALTYRGHDRRPRRLAYDHVVLACGSSVNHSEIPGMADHALPLKTIGDALAIRAHVVSQLERADACSDARRCAWYLSFAVVGGGFSGVEVAGEINDLARSGARLLPNVSPGDVRVRLVHSRDQILPEVAPRLRDFARLRMERAGIEMVLSARAASVTRRGIQLTDGRRLAAGTVVSAIGNTTPPLLEQLGVPLHRGRLATSPDLRVKGAANAWAVGDCAWAINQADGEPCPPTGQFAERQGRQVADNVVRALRGAPTSAFAYRPKGQLCSIGGRRAVGEILGLRIAGFPAWFLWRGVYLLKLPTWRLRLKVGFDWAWEALFARDLAHVKVERSDRISIAHYAPGECVFDAGDPATELYVIRSGEAEVLTSDDAASREPVAVLGPGDFFGEMALFEGRPHRHAVRARSRLEVMVAGRHVFEHITRAFPPLGQMLARTAKSRARVLWPQTPVALDVLSRLRLSDLAQPLPTPPLSPDDGFFAALSRLDAVGPDFSCVADGAGALAGIVTRTDLLRAVEAGLDHEPRVREFMNADPVAIASDEPPLAAAALLREHGLKWLPVVDRATRQLVGCLRAETLLERVVEEARRRGRPDAQAGGTRPHDDAA